MQTFIERLKQFFAQLSDFWNGLPLNQRVLFSGLVLLVFVAGAVLLVRGSQTPYEILYTDLSAKDAAAIIAKLDEDQVAYKLADAGTTILVPAEVKYATRINLANEDLPGSQAGLELFRQSSFGETQTDKKVKYQEALQGELARTIQALDKVKAANVVLALPEQSLFSDQETPPKASVVIRTNNGQSLTPQEIQGIINLVSHSVERLEPDNVVIVDQDGTLLTGDLPPIDDLSDRLAVQMTMKREFEKSKEEAIQTMLDKTFGKDNAVVRVNADLEFNDVEQHDERYSHDPDGSFVRSEELVNDAAESIGGVLLGVPGTDTNIPIYNEVEANNEAESSWEHKSTIRNYEINRTDTITKYAAGEVKYDYLTVSVLVNNQVAERANFGTTEEERIAKIRGIVATACGLAENRTDETVNLERQVSVAFIDFYTEPQPEVAVQGFLTSFMSSSYGPVVLTLLIIAIIALAWLLLKRKQQHEEEVEEPVPEGIESIIEEEIKVEDLLDMSMTPEDKDLLRVRQEIDRLIDENPEAAANVIKAWLAQDMR